MTVQPADADDVLVGRARLRRAASAGGLGQLGGVAHRAGSAPTGVGRCGVPGRPGWDGADPVVPAGTSPRASRNRLHVDVKVSGGRGQPAELRRQRIQDAVDRLIDAGATVKRYDDPNGVLDHVVMADPEGNEFCVV